MGFYQFFNNIFPAYFLYSSIQAGQIGFWAGIGFSLIVRLHCVKTLNTATFFKAYRKSRCFLGLAVKLRSRFLKISIFTNNVKWLIFDVSLPSCFFIWPDHISGYLRQEKKFDGICGEFLKKPFEWWLLPTTALHLYSIDYKVYFNKILLLF
jgi:hypothetical protein